MKAAGLSLDVVAYTAPQQLHAVNAAERRGQPWTIFGIDVHKKESQISALHQNL